MSEPQKSWIPMLNCQIEIVRKIIAERARQEKLKAERRFNFTAATPGLKHTERLPMLVEELGEVSKRVQQLPDSGLMPTTHAGNFDAHAGGDPDPEAGTIEGLERELVQVAAISVAWLEAIDSTRAAAARTPWKPQSAPPPVSAA